MNRNIYLCKCDLINKINISNINNCPSITKVVLEVFSPNLKTSNVSYQLKSLFFLYITSGMNPKILYKAINRKILTNDSKKKNSGYFNKVCLESKKNIDTFVNYMFLENDFKKHINDYQLKKCHDSSSTVNYCVDVPLLFFKEVVELFNFDIKDISTKNICVRINFIIKTNTKVEDKLIKNLFPFWYFG